MDHPIVQTYGTSDDGLNCSPNITSTPRPILPPPMVDGALILSSSFFFKTWRIDLMFSPL